MSVFGEEFDEDWPLKDFDREITDFGQEQLKKCLNIQKPEDSKANIQEFINKSNEFPIEFPSDTCRVKSQPEERRDIIEQQIASAYPLVHEKVLYLIIDFLEHKKKYGSSIEKELYANMSFTEFVQRLLIKRCVSFVGFHDSYLLMSGETGDGEKYLKIGLLYEEYPLTLANVLCYDEIKISALLSVSSHTEFINNGSRNNSAKIPYKFEMFEKNGVLVGLIGARFARKNRMEFEDIKITTSQNVNRLYLPPLTEEKKAKLSYSTVWNKFYDEENDRVYCKTQIDNKRFGESYQPNEIFDNVIMKKRYSICFDLLLLEANERALKQHKLAYIHVVAIGLRYWRAAAQQEEIFLESFQQRLKYLLPQLNNIGVVHFSWFHLTGCGDLSNENVLKSETHSEGGIKILISKRNPHDILLPPYENMLPVASFGWDGNALPGNEFWMGYLHTSNGASAASSTLIAELLNPHINTEYVNSNNLHIASPKYGILHIKNYAEKILC